jgi:pilus assembly protein CpaF
MRPDRIIVGEVRGAEMAEFLTAANSGADGSMTTVHANTPQQAINKMLSLSSKDENAKSEASLLRDIASTVQVIVQMSIIDGRHIVSQIEEVSNTVNKNTMGIQTSTIYRFDRNTGRFNFENRISDEFQMFLKQRGVEVTNPSNFMTRF